MYGKIAAKFSIWAEIIKMSTEDYKHNQPYVVLQPNLKKILNRVFQIHSQNDIRFCNYSRHNQNTPRMTTFFMFSKIKFSPRKNHF